MLFDVLMFNGGMKTVGRPVKKIGRLQYYGISCYQDLNHLLGKNWHVRGLNGQGDYGYAIQETVQFFIKKCKPLTEYIVSSTDDYETSIIK